MINLFFVILDHSGARTYANEFFAYLSEIQGIALHKVFFESKYHKEYRVIREGNITEIHLPHIQNSSRSLEKYSNRCIDLMQTLLENKKDNLIFHLNSSVQIKLGIKVRERFDAKLIYTLHFLPDYFSHLGYDDNWQINLETTGDTLEREMISEADRVICVTHFAKEAICRYYETSPQKVEAIHNGFSSFTDSPLITGESVKTIRKALRFGEYEKIILFVGLIEPRKGLNFLIKAFNQITGMFPDARLVIAGDGDFKKALSNVNRCWSKITFTGKIPYIELEYIYKIATVGVIPSVYEQCSYVALEMMKYGLPVVVAAAPGLRELYTNGENALVVPLHKADNDLMKLDLHEDELTEALASMLNDKTLRQKLSENARSGWEQFHTVENMGNATIEQYKQLLTQIKESKNTNNI